WVRRSARCVDFPDARVGMGRSQELAVRHAWQENIVGEARLTGYLGPGVDSSARNSDHTKLIPSCFWSAHALGPGIHFIWHPPPAFSPVTFLRNSLHCNALLRDFEHSGFDSFKDLQVARATAQVSRDRFADFIASRVGIVIQ